MPIILIYLHFLLCILLWIQCRVFSCFNQSDLSICCFSFQLKNIEDDPNVTPGSVTLPPLLTSMTKASSSISSELPSLSLASSTWSYNPQQHSVGGEANKNGTSKVSSAWSDGSSNSFASDLWSSINTTKQGSVGPPGLASATTTSGSRLTTSTGGSMSWGGLGRSAWPGDQRTSQSNSALQQPSQGDWSGQPPPSTWLILKNLTPQVTLTHASLYTCLMECWWQARELLHQHYLLAFTSFSVNFSWCFPCCPVLAVQHFVVHRLCSVFVQ